MGTQTRITETIDQLRELIERSAPHPEQAEPVRSCDADDVLDTIIPFSSLMVLGTVIAIEDHFSIDVKRSHIEEAALNGFTLRKLALAVIEATSSSTSTKEPT